MAKKAKVVKMPSGKALDMLKRPYKGSREKAKAVVKKKTDKKFSGKTSGLGIAVFQNKTLVDNKKHKLSDKQLAKSWRSEFPKAKAYTEKDVSSVRQAFNKGKHGNDVPARLVLEYDAQGNPVKKASSAPPKKVAKVVTRRAAKRSRRNKDDDEEEESVTASDDEDEEEE